MTDRKDRGADEPLRIMVDPMAIGRAIEALIACSDDLGAELRARYPDEARKYPSEVRRKHRDMQSVRDARASISELNRTPGFTWAGDD